MTAAKATLSERMAKIKSELYVEQFASFLAMEMLTANIDGYSFNRNNYRVYHHPKTDKLVFLPHGLDATFGSASFKPPTNSIVVRALWEMPEFQQTFRTRLGELAEKVWRVESITNQVHGAMARLTTLSPALAAPLAQEAKRLVYQVEQQQRFIESEFKRGSNE